VRSGVLLARRYRLERLLGRGGMGEVWRAYRTDTEVHVAIKFLRGDIVADSATRKRFIREARAAAAVRHPNVVEMYAVEENDGTPFLVMELLNGETLGSHLRRKSRLSPSEAAAILLPVFDAVEAAHTAGIIHRDLKPENIFLGRDGSEVRIRVLDFGIAKQIEKLAMPMDDASELGGTTAPVSTTRAMLGSPHYMSPEQALGEPDIDGRSDLWSLGVILYECLSGRLPTEATTLGGVLKLIVTDGITPLGVAVPELDPQLALATMGLLRSDRKLRTASLDAMRSALGVFARADLRLELPPEEGPPSFATFVPLVRGRRMLWPLAALVVAASSGLGWMQWQRSTTTRAMLRPQPRGPAIHATLAAGQANTRAALPAAEADAGAGTRAPLIDALPRITPTSRASVRTVPEPALAAPARTPAAASAGQPARGPSGLVTDNPFLR
jgi:eukaryotic-like serine/threonine-protein kinase